MAEKLSAFKICDASSCCMVWHNLYCIPWYCVILHGFCIAESQIIDSIEVIFSDWRYTGAGLNEIWNSCWIYIGDEANTNANKVMGYIETLLMWLRNI